MLFLGVYVQGRGAWCGRGVHGGVCGQLYFNIGAELCAWRDFQSDLQYVLAAKRFDLRQRDRGTKRVRKQK